MHLENYRLRKMAKVAGYNERVLDIGCSQLPNVHLKAKELIGFDLNNGKLTKNYSELVIGDVFEIEQYFELESFDAVVVGEVLEHTSLPMEFLEKIRSVLIPEGKVIISTPNPNSFIERILTVGLSEKYFYTSEHRMLYPQRWLIRLLKDSGFNKIELFSGGFPLPFIGLVPFPRPWCYQTIAVAHA